VPVPPDKVLLVTAFGPYDGVLNASEAVVESLRRDPPGELSPLGDRVAFHVFDCDTATLAVQLEKVLLRCRPATCLFVGQARDSNRARLERLAVNVRDFGVPDARGGRPCNLAVVEGGAAAYRSTLPRMEAIVSAWHDADLPGVLSNHAGTHLCNQLLYLALHRAACRSEALEAGFLHLPVLPQQVPRDDHHGPWMSLAMSRRAVAIAISRLLA
jgi:pyroglutamyl-peptidase